ncbi:unnamed protein product [Cunninghamella echinulata]
MKLQLVILGLFAAVVLAKNEGGTEAKNYDSSDCVVIRCGTNCPTGKVKSVKGEFVVKGICKVECCKSLTGANDEVEEKEENEDEERERGKGRNEASILNKRLNRNLKKRLSSIDY